MKFWKVAAVDEVDDPDSWETAYAQDAYSAALAHFKYLCERNGLPIEEMDLIVWPEAGGDRRSYRMKSRPVLTFSAEEMETAHG